MESETARKALDYAARVLAPRMLSEQTLREKLSEHDFDDDDIDYAVERLTEFGAINDAEYAQSIAKYYANRGYGKQKVAQELHRRGIPRDIAAETIEDFEPCSAQVIAYLEKTIKDN
ncbi:MAG: regulatory protein RecX, partial [Christensenellaceae bacterium]